MIMQTFYRVQRGSVLITGLIFLVILTLIGLSAMQVTGMEERMAGNSKDMNLALQAAEAVLRDCESLMNKAVVPTFGESYGLYDLPASLTPRSDADLMAYSPLWGPESATNPPKSHRYGMTETNTVPPGGAKTVAGVAMQPRCIVEAMPAVAGDGGGSLKAGMALPDIGSYRITARGVGGTETAVVFLQTYYKR